jgi:selenocysteine-specific elongation factor
MRVIGTAGHVDHGKSTLVRALSGIDPDRLREEKARGMTIDLGFAWIDLPTANPQSDTPDNATEAVGIVDVPGHIDFIKNMLAGVGGIDAAVLVIAADEGVMPQTREHLAILDLLGVPAGVVALTKVDTIDDPEWLDLVELDVAELLEPTRLADAPIVRVSAITGAGLDALRHALAETLGQLAPRRDRARPRLPIDRVFTLSGFGTVVTGTLSDGHFAVGDAVEVLPAGLPARIRGLQSHKQAVDQGEPGSRLAMNLTGVGTDEVHRGDVVVRPGTLRATTLIDAEFRMLPDAPKALAHNQAVDFFVGAAEVPARVRVLGADALEPGQSGWVQLRLERPVVTAAGDRFILRRPSPSITLGGGTVLSPHPRRRWKRFDPRVIARLETLARGAPDEILLHALARQPFISRQELIGQSGLDVSVADDALDELTQSGAIVPLGSGDPLLVTLDVHTRTLAQLTARLDEFHAAQPLRRGMARGELRSRVQTAGSALPVRIFNALLEQAVSQGDVAADETLAWRNTFTVAPTPPQQRKVDRVLAAYAAAPYAPPNAGDTLAMLDGDEALLEMMVEQGQLVRLPGGVFLRGADFDAMVTAVSDHMAAHGTITLAETRDLFDTSRKYAQALLEEMDARRITRRDGDARVLRK